MNTFKSAVQNREARTENGMKARATTTNSCVDFFFKVGASRGKDITHLLISSIVEDVDTAIRIILWTRDIREGAGERELFRQACSWLDRNKPELAIAILPKIKELGRFDDYFVFKTPEVRLAAFEILKQELNAGNALAAKWCPREKSINKFLEKKVGKENLKGFTHQKKMELLSSTQRNKILVAKEFRTFLGLSEKAYRKLLSSCTKVVETDMCSNNWDNINFSHVPSVASSRYKKAFNRHTPNYAEYVSKLISGDTSVKVNASSIFPYDVLNGVYGKHFTKTEQDLVVAQWNALPNFVGDANILPMVDVSGSMTCPAGKNANLTCLDVAVSLGLYLSEKNTGKFKDLFLTFSEKSEMLHLKGTVVERMQQMTRSSWGMNTNLHKAFEEILKIAVNGKVSQEEMPKMLLILSDMQFDACISFDDCAIEMMQRKYSKAGYSMPQIVFWNINSYDNVPVSCNTNGVALVSGFSPSIVKSVLAAEPEQFTPYGIMMATLSSDRYNWR